MQAFLMILLLLTSSFMVLLVLIQRGRGGGLAGAFGGMGSQSAFGTKAGDLFTKVTIGVALFWIFLCIATIKIANWGDSPLDASMGRTAAPAGPAAPTTPQTPAAPAGGANPAVPAGTPEANPPAEAPPTPATP